MAFHCCGVTGGHTPECAEGRDLERQRDEASWARRLAPSRSLAARDTVARERLAMAMERIAAALEAKR